MSAFVLAITPAQDLGSGLGTFALVALFGLAWWGEQRRNRGR